jgi:hypothetical protein
MELFLTPLHILLTAVAGFLVGAVWYSPILFLKPWLASEGLTKEHMQNNGLLYQIQIQLYSFVAHAAMAAVLAVLFDIIEVGSLEVAVSLGLLITFGFVVTGRFIDMVYTTKGKHFERQPQMKFLISSGYYLATIAVMSAVLFSVSTY